MLRSFALAAGVGAACPLSALADTVAIDPGSRWRVGSEARYERVRTQQPSKQSSLTPVTVRVIEAGPSGFVVSWKEGRSRMTGAPTEAAQALDGLLEGRGDVEYVLELGSSGQFRALRNWEDVRARALAEIDKAPARAGVPEASQAQGRAWLKQRLATRAEVERLVLAEVRTFFMLYGWRLEPGAVRMFEERVVSPFGGALMPGRATVTLASAGGGRATVRYSLEVDREKWRKHVVDAFAGLAKTRNREIPPERLKAIADTWQLTDTAELVLDLATGWPVTVTRARATTVDGRASARRIEYVRQP